MKSSVAVFIAALAALVSSAIAVPLEARTPDNNGKLSPIAQCIRRTYPDYPHTAIIDNTVVDKCFGPLASKARRDDAGNSSSDVVTTDELVYEPGNLETRQFVDRILAAGKDLILQQNPHCTIDEVPDSFLWVKDIMPKAGSYCQRIQDKLQLGNILEKGGVAHVTETLGIGHDKRGHQLKDNMKVGLQIAIQLAASNLGQTPATALAIAKAIYEICDDGIERILTKGSGCTQEIQYYRPSKAKHYTDDAARSGELAMYWDGLAIGKIFVDVFN